MDEYNTERLLDGLEQAIELLTKINDNLSGKIRKPFLEYELLPILEEVRKAYRVGRSSMRHWDVTAAELRQFAQNLAKVKLGDFGPDLGKYLTRMSHNDNFPGIKIQEERTKDTHSKYRIQLQTPLDAEPEAAKSASFDEEIAEGLYA